MKILVDYFAALREQAGITHETVTVSDTSPAGLYQMLAERHTFTLTQSDLKLAVNDEFVAWSYTLADGDRVVFIPPVSGG